MTASLRRLRKVRAAALWAAKLGRTCGSDTVADRVLLKSMKGACNAPPRSSSARKREAFAPPLNFLFDQSLSLSLGIALVEPISQLRSIGLFNSFSDLLEVVVIDYFSTTSCIAEVNTGDTLVIED